MRQQKSEKSEKMPLINDKFESCIRRLSVKMRSENMCLAGSTPRVQVCLYRTVRALGVGYMSSNYTLARGTSARNFAEQL